MTISQQPETAPEGIGTEVPTGPVPAVPQQRGTVVVDPTPVPTPVRPSGVRRAWPWIAGAVIAVLVVVVVVLAAALASATGPATAPAAAPTPVAPVPSAAPAPATTASAAPTVPAAPPAPPRAINARDWQQIAKAPDAHIGESVIVYGHVTQFDAGTGSASFRANVDGVTHRQWYEYETNTLLGGDQTALKDLVQGDLFRAEVVVRGSYTYSTTMGGQTTAPLLAVTKVKVTGSAG